MLHAMDPSFPAMMKKTTFNGFVRDGISPKIIDELVMASLLCNYGQDTNVHQFVGKFVSKKITFRSQISGSSLVSLYFKILNVFLKK